MNNKKIIALFLLVLILSSTTAYAANVNSYNTTSYTDNYKYQNIFVQPTNAIGGVLFTFAETMYWNVDTGSIISKTSTTDFAKPWWSAWGIQDSGDDYYGEVTRNNKIVEIHYSSAYIFGFGIQVGSGGEVKNSSSGGVTVTVGTTIGQSFSKTSNRIVTTTSSNSKCTVN